MGDVEYGSRNYDGRYEIRDAGQIEEELIPICRQSKNPFYRRWRRFNRECRIWDSGFVIGNWELGIDMGYEI